MKDEREVFISPQCNAHPPKDSCYKSSHSNDHTKENKAHASNEHQAYLDFSTDNAYFSLNFKISTRCLLDRNSW